MENINAEQAYRAMVKDRREKLRKLYRIANKRPRTDKEQAELIKLEAFLGTQNPTDESGVRLTPDGLKYNRERISRAEKAVNAYFGRDYYKQEGDETCIKDMITDLLHLANSRGVLVYDMLDSAKNHFECERQGL